MILPIVLAAALLLAGWGWWSCRGQAADLRQKHSSLESQLHASNVSPFW